MGEWMGVVDDGEDLGPEPDLDRYESAKTWTGLTKKEEREREKDRERRKRKNPRAFAKDPEMLFARPASEWADIVVEAPPADYLFGPFWLVEELAVMFGGTGTGKSALAMQIAESIARGVRLPPFTGPGIPKPDPRRVLYLDFELSPTQFAMRYARIDGDNAAFGRRYRFSPNLARAEMYWNGEVLEGYDGFSDMFFQALDNLIYAEDVTVVVVDNITFLDRSSTSNAGAALNIMRSLQYLRSARFISILVLAHTPKRRPWAPMTELDLQGSINLANFADSIFAVGRSRVSPDLRYLKQIKVRTGRPEFVHENVPVFAFEKYDLHTALRCGPPWPTGDEARDFLGFRFTEFAHEDDHLETGPFNLRENSRRPKHSRALIRRAKKLAKEGKSFGAIAGDLGIPKTTVRRYVANA